jgi:hypothetical protein
MIRASLSIGVVMIFATIVHAQRPDDRQGRPAGPPRGFAGPSGFNLMTALDADKDGKISAKEIENAVAALQKLDKNKDGKLSPEEIGWPPSSGRGGFSGFDRGGFGRLGGQPPGAGGRPGQRGGGFGPGGPSRQGRAEGGGSITPEAILSQFDTNKDGKLTKNEIPRESQRLQQMLKDADKNRDGVLTKQELTQYLSNAEGRGGRQQQGGVQQSRGQRPGGGRSQPGGGFQRPEAGGGRSGGGSRGGNFIEIGQPLPNLTVYDSNGNEFKLSSLKGKYSVLVFGCLT